MTQTFTAPARINLLGEHTDYTGGFVLPMAIGFHTDSDHHAAHRLALHVRQRALSKRSHPNRHRRPLRRPAALVRLPHRRPPHVAAPQHRHPRLRPRPRRQRPPQLRPQLLRIGRSRHRPRHACPSRASNSSRNKSLSSASEQKTISSAPPAASWTSSSSPPPRRPRHAARHALPHLRSPPYTPRHTNSSSATPWSSTPSPPASTASAAAKSKPDKAILAENFTHIRLLRDATLDELNFCRAQMSARILPPLPPHPHRQRPRPRRPRSPPRRQTAKQFGELMLAAHASQRDDFACCCEEIDFLVDTAATLPGCFGARMTGGGFGGCTVNLVKPNPQQKPSPPNSAPATSSNTTSPPKHTSSKPSTAPCCATPQHSRRPHA